MGFVGASGTKYCFKILDTSKTWAEHVEACSQDSSPSGTLKGYLAEPNGEAQGLLKDSGLLTGKS